MEAMMAVTIDDVKRVYEKYIKGKNFVATSFVPKGKVDLAAEGSVDAHCGGEHTDCHRGKGGNRCCRRD